MKWPGHCNGADAMRGSYNCWRTALTAGAASAGASVAADSATTSSQYAGNTGTATSSIHVVLRMAVV